MIQIRAVLVLVGLIAWTPVASAQQPCPTLRVDTGYARPGSGGTFDYWAQISNMGPRPVRFSIIFLMPQAQANPANARAVYTLAPQGQGTVVLGNGLGIAQANRIVAGVRLACR